MVERRGFETGELYLRRAAVRAGTLLVSLLLCISAQAAPTVVNIVDRQHLRFGWAPAPGQVDGYVVFVSTNGSDPVPRDYVNSGTEITIESQYGDTISVTVAASGVLNGAIVGGPQSDPSDLYRFVQSPSVDDGSGAASVRHDFDGDGRADILVTDRDGDVRLWTMSGLTRIDDRLLFNVGGATPAAVGDFDGDSTADSMWRQPDGTLYAVLGSGVANFDPRPGFEVGSSGDYDGDGRTDLLLRNATTLELEIWLLDGPVTQRTVTIPSPLGSRRSGGRDWTLRGSGDFDGDGNDDLVWVHTFGFISISFMEAGQIAEQLTVDGSAGSGVIVAIGDLDGDGRSDLTIRENRSLIGWLMDAATIVEQVRIAQTVGWPVIGSRDLNGDGRDDLLFAGSGGEVAAMLMDGTSILTFGTIEPTASGFTVFETR